MRIKQMEENLKSKTRFRGAGKIALFFCFVIGVIVAVDAILDSGMRQIKTSSFGVWNGIVQGRINADIVIGGSSRALTHYDSRIIQSQTGRSVFNIGLNGSQTDMQVARIKTYLSHNVQPSLLIFNLDLFSFQTTHGGAYDPGQYVPYLGEPAIYAALSRIDPETWKEKYFPLYGYAVKDLRFNWVMGLLGFFGWNPTEDHFLGFKPQRLAWTQDFERFKEMNRKGVSFDVEPNGVREMQELLRLCRQRGISILLVYSPEYIEMQTLTTNRSAVFERFRELSERFGSVLWDYSSSPISENRENFYNSQHLNAKGAAAFSADLAARLAAHPGIVEPPRLGNAM
jgi:hypothetical protein